MFKLIIIFCIITLFIYILSDFEIASLKRKIIDNISLTHKVLIMHKI